MTMAIMRYELSEPGVKTALIEARGDLFLAAQLIGITALRLERTIRASETLVQVYGAMNDLAIEDGFSKLTDAQIKQAVTHRLALYRVDGLDALHELATMPIGDNSAMAQVKLSAAARLSGTAQESGTDNLGDILRELNSAYQENAPRIRVTRERISLEVSPPEKS